jgi:catalase
MTDHDMQISYVPYSDAVEVPIPNEERVFDEIAATMRHIAEIIGDRARHAARAVHAKSHGLLKADLTVADSLPEPFRQGLFSRPDTYPAVMRFSTNPGDMLPDSISSPRGLAVKLIGVQGEMLPGHERNTTQDFAFVNGKAFAVKDAAAFLKQVHLIERHVTDSQTFKQIVSTTARIAEATLERLGTESATLRGFGHPETHILGETYTSVATLRFGNYLAKIAFVPASDNLVALKGKHLEHANEYSALRDAIVKFFDSESAVWDVKAQLCADLTKMPVEDASVQWPEDLSPYVTVGRLAASKQAAYSAERRVFVDEILSFNPWHGLAAHRPLGNIMRARRQAYPMSSAFRHTVNVRPTYEPKWIDELPA